MISSDRAKLRYNRHRERVKRAKAIIDHSPPIIHAGNLARLSKLKEDVDTYLLRYGTNIRLLVSMNRIQRTKGELDTFRTHYHKVENDLRQRIQAIKSLEKLNMEFGKFILCTKGGMTTLPTEPLKQKRKRNTLPFAPPMHILKKYNNIQIPQDPIRLRKLFRPKIWFNLEVKGYRPLGIVVIQLYTEAAPQVVLELMRLCFHRQNDRIEFVRLFTGLWGDVNITLDSDTLINKNIEYDMRALDHGKHSGVFSFGLNMNNTILRRGVFNFSISFKPLSVLNGRRIGFGHVIKGAKTLNCMQDYSTKNGKPTKDLVISNCGIY